MKSAGKRRLRLLSNNPERRASTRFRLALEVRYTVLLPGGKGTSGSGVTIDVSSSGLSFLADQPLRVGQRLELAIDWPVMLDHGVQLQLTISGVVVRAETTVTALRIDRHEFKTRRIGPQLLPIEPPF
jgi:hypothetical protein